MPAPRRSDFANDNHLLGEGDRDAIRIALSLPDAGSLRAALRVKLAAVRLRSRPPPAYKPAVRPIAVDLPAVPAGLSLMARNAAPRRTLSYYANSFLMPAE